jgi:hypothetical protein
MNGAANGLAATAIRRVYIAPATVTSWYLCGGCLYMLLQLALRPRKQLEGRERYA